MVGGLARAGCGKTSEKWREIFQYLILNMRRNTLENNQEHFSLLLSLLFFACPQLSSPSLCFSFSSLSLFHPHYKCAKRKKEPQQ